NRVDYCFFFFSSRRRHTRFSRDWSSDVCSSDLYSASRSQLSRSERDRDRLGHDHRVGRRAGSVKTTRITGHAGTEETGAPAGVRSEEHTSELQSRENLVCRLLLEKKNKLQ